MLVAVVHSGGSEAAQRVLARAQRRYGVPAHVQRASQCAIAGWSSSKLLTFGKGFAVEGRLESAADLGHAATKDHFEWALGLSGDFALLCATDDGLLAVPGRAGGHRPLFLATGADWIAASSTLKVLLDLLEARPPVDVDYLAGCVLADIEAAATGTPYRGLVRIPLGEGWRLRPGCDVARRKNTGRTIGDQASVRDVDLAPLLREEIAAAVDRAARGAQKIGVMLSGGLDSSSVLVTLDGLRRDGRVAAPIDAYAWEFDTPDPHDDRPFRRAVERRFGKKSVAIDPGNAGPFVRRSMTLDAAPCFDIPCALWLALDAAARKRGADRIFSGLGGDNVLDGQPWLLAQLFVSGKPFAALRRASALKGFGGGSPWSRVRHFILRPLLRGLEPGPVRSVRTRLARRRRFDWMGAGLRRWSQQRDSQGTGARVTLESSPAERYDHLARMPFLGLITRIRSQQEEATECRRVDPLFDDELLRFVARLPPLALLAGDSRRGLLRAAMAEQLPDMVAARPWKAYMEPALARMVASAGGFDAFKDLAQVRRLAALSLIEPKPFASHFRRLSERPLEPLWWTVWPALAAEEFLRQYEEGWSTE